jgi:Spy/CpxP family protein refolding chaperone
MIDRKKMAALGLAAALLGGAALTVHAQGHGFHGKGGPEAMDMMEKHAEMLVHALGLTDEQHAAARKIHEEVAAKAAPLAEQHHQQMAEVRALLDGASPDATEVGQKMIAAHATKKQLEALHEDAMTRFSALLNPEQLEKLQKIHEEHREHGPLGHHGPGH